MHGTRRDVISYLLAASVLAGGLQATGTTARTAIQPVSALPAPSGPFPVGRTVSNWVDVSRAERYAETAGKLRELLIWIWYPAAPPPGAETDAYAPAGWEATGDLWGFETEGAQSHAFPEAPVADAESQYPVLLFSGNGFPAFNHTAILEEIASHGYVVVGLTHPYQTPVTVFPDGRTVPMAPTFSQSFFGPFTEPVSETLRQREAIVDYKVSDLQSVLHQLELLDRGSDRLAHRLDLKRIGAFGHSMGGNAALELCRIDRRCRAAVNLDGANWTEVGRTGLSQPAMLITVERPEAGPCPESDAYPAAVCEADRVVTATGWQVVAETAQPSYTVTIAGASHLSFLDLPFLPARPGGMVDAGIQATTIDPIRMWRITSDYLLAFFAEHLNGASAPLLAGPTNDYPEVTFVTNRVGS
jgi:predicted dienelactone hydrolase